MKPKIALVVPALVKGGGVPAVARFVKDTVIRDGRYDLRIVSLCMASNDPCSTHLLKPASWLFGVQIEDGTWGDLPFSHVGAAFGEFEFQRYRRRQALTALVADCDLIQVVCGSPAWANSVIGLGKPVALQVATLARVERRKRDMHMQNFAGFWRKLMTYFTEKLDERALRRVDAIQVENMWMLDRAREIIADRNIDLQYAPPGVDSALFYPLTKRDSVCRNYILCVGRLDDPRKNVDLLLSAYACLPPSLRGKIELVLAGASGPGPDFWRRAEELGVQERVRYVSQPSQSELINLYQKASVFALPSDEEGLGVVVLEAMSCGIPVVATRCGGPEGIITDGKDGFLVPLENVGEMADRLQRLLEKPSINHEMGRNARATIEKRYDERVAGVAFTEIWGQLLA